MNELNIGGLTIGMSRAYKGVSDNQKLLNEITPKLGGGQKYSDISEISADGKLGMSIDIDSALSEVDNYIKHNQNVQNFIATTDDQMSELLSIAQKAVSEITSAQSISGEVIDIGLIATQKLEQIEQILNSAYDNKKIFGGFSNENPVQGLTSKSNLVYDENSQEYIITANYTDVADEELIVEINVGQRVVTNPATASHESIQKLIGALNFAKQGDVDNSAKYLKESIGGLIGLQSKVNNTINSIDQASKSLEKAKENLNESQSNNFEMDIIEAYKNMEALMRAQTLNMSLVKMMMEQRDFASMITS